jgi:hypothetical protein
MFGPKREKVARGWRRLRNEEHHNLHASPNVVRVIKKNEIGGACSTRDKRIAYRILVGKPEGKRPLGRPTRRW